METDEKGRVKLSMKVLADRPAGGSDRPAPAERGDREPRRDHGRDQGRDQAREGGRDAGRHPADQQQQQQQQSLLSDGASDQVVG